MDQRNVLAHLHFVFEEDIRRMAQTAGAKVVATIVDGEEVYKA